MSRKASIVVGLGFGDEGKGLTTDYLCSRAKEPLVIRFNGGQQAGHTVCLPDGRRHVFSNFGAGTLRGAATYWSSFCTCALPNILTEYKALLSLNVFPILYLDKHCAITTHYDVLYNRLQEQQRCGNRHGSCGMGFGVTVQREEAGVSFTVNDLLQPNVCRKLLADIKTYYTIKAQKELNIDFSSFKHDTEDARFADYISQFHQLLNTVFFIADEEMIFASTHWSEYIFEGAQGILLDMNFGYFPHVTRSYTTSRNAMEIISRHKAGISSAEIWYVSRVYHTRHGAGPFVFEYGVMQLKNNETETNIFNDYQGKFRIGPLDIDRVRCALKSDDTFSHNITKNLMLTCVDQVDKQNVMFRLNNTFKKTSVCQMPSLISNAFTKVLMSENEYACFE